MDVGARWAPNGSRARVWMDIRDLVTRSSWLPGISGGHVSDLPSGKITENKWKWNRGDSSRCTIMATVEWHRGTMSWWSQNSVVSRRYKHLNKEGYISYYSSMVVSIRTSNSSTREPGVHSGAETVSGIRMHVRSKKLEHQVWRSRDWWVSGVLFIRNSLTYILLRRFVELIHVKCLCGPRIWNHGPDLQMFGRRHICRPQEFC